MKALLYLISFSVFALADMQTITFRELTKLVSLDLHKTILLDKDIPKYQLEYNNADYNKPGQLYEFYKIVLFDNNLKLTYNKKGDFYYVKKIYNNPTTVPVLPPKPIPSLKDELHYYTYKIRNITNKDVIDCMSIFPDIKYKYLAQSDMIAYSATLEQHKQIDKILKSADNKVISRSIKITIFSVDKNKLKQSGTTINQFGLSFSLNVALNLVDSITKTYTFNGGFDIDLFMTYLNRYGIIKVKHSPTILLTNGVEATINSVANIRYVTGVAQVDNSNNNTVRENYQYQDVGLKIKMIPKVTSKWVYIDLSLVSEELLSYQPDNPVIGKVSYHNSFKVVKGHPLLLTGINKTVLKKSNNSIPGLSNIPILGLLFKGKDTDITESNINILIDVL